MTLPICRCSRLLLAAVLFSFTVETTSAQQYPSSHAPDRFHTLEASPHRGQLLSAPILRITQPASTQVSKAQPKISVQARANQSKTFQDNQKKSGQGGKNLPPQATAGQMASMLDEVAGGKSPTLPPHPPGAHYAAQAGHLPPSYAAHGSARNVYARSSGMVPARGGYMPARNGMPSHNMMGGFGHAGMPGGMPREIIRPQSMGGAGGLGAMAGGGGIEAQLMQKLFHGGMPGATGMPGANGMAGPGAMAGFGGMPMGRPSFGMQPAAIRRPGAGPGIAPGAQFGAQPRGQGAASNGSASDLEKQMEAQYGK